MAGKPCIVHVRPINNRFYLYYYKKVAGKWTQRLIRGESFDKEMDASLRAAELTVEYSKKAPPANQAVLFREVADKWLEITLSRISAKSTKRRYRTQAAQVTEAFGGYPVARITQRDIEIYLTEFAKTHAPRTTNKNLNTIRAILRLSADWGYIEVSPADKVATYKTRRARIEVLTPGEVFNIASHASDRARAAILTAYYTGMRIGEVLALRWEHINLVEGSIIVEGGKTDAAMRMLPMSRVLIKELYIWGEKSGKSGPVFPNGAGTGNQIDYNKFRRTEWWPALKATGYSLERGKRIGLHSLRHSFASYLIQSGQDVLTVAGLMGHRDPTTTMREYGHLFDGAKRAAIAKMDSDLEALYANTMQKDKSDDSEKPSLSLIKP